MHCYGQEEKIKSCHTVVTLMGMTNTRILDSFIRGAAQKKSFASRKMRAKVADSAKDPPCYIDKKKVSFSYKWIELYAQTKSWLILLQYDEYVSILDNDLLILCIFVFTLMTKSDSAICRWVQNSNQFTYRTAWRGCPSGGSVKLAGAASTQLCC